MTDFNNEFDQLVQDAVITATRPPSEPLAASAATVSPEEAYKRFVHGLSEGLDNLLAQKLTIAIASVAANSAISTEINGVDWLHDYLVGKTVGLAYYWPTPGYDSPMSIQHHMANGDATASSEVNAKGVSVGITATINF